jgi:hypothetical protein
MERDYVISYTRASTIIMKLFLIVTSLVFLSNAYGQEVELKGRYGASFLGTESIEFVGKDSFYFNAFYCIEGFNGKGRCEIRDNYLYLFFENDNRKSDTIRPAIIIPSKNTDSISTIQLTLVDNYDKPVPYTTVEVVTDKGVQPGSYIAPEGHTQLRIRNDVFPIVLKTSALGFNRVNLQLDSSSNYAITLYHTYFDFNHVLNKGQTWVYEIEELSEDLIVMRPKSGGEFRKYRKR